MSRFKDFNTQEKMSLRFALTTQLNNARSSYTEGMRYGDPELEQSRCKFRIAMAEKVT